MTVTLPLPTQNHFFATRAHDPLFVRLIVGECLVVDNLRVCRVPPQDFSAHANAVLAGQKYSDRKPKGLRLAIRPGDIYVLPGIAENIFAFECNDLTRIKAKFNGKSTAFELGYGHYMVDIFKL